MVKCQRDFTMVQWPIGRERKQNPQPEPWLAARGNKRPLWRQWEDKMKKKMLSLLLCGCLAASALAGLITVRLPGGVCAGRLRKGFRGRGCDQYGRGGRRGGSGCGR